MLVADDGRFKVRSLPGWELQFGVSSHKFAIPDVVVYDQDRDGIAVVIIQEDKTLTNTADPFAQVQRKFLSSSARGHCRSNCWLPT